MTLSFIENFAWSDTNKYYFLSLSPGGSGDNKEDEEDDLMLLDEVEETPSSSSERKRKQDPADESPAVKKMRSVGVIDNDIIVL